MRILIFHGDLTQPSGAEVNARDWATGFKQRGHKVAVYAPRLGPLAQELRNAGVLVVDNPRDLTDVPDVIMGSGVNELATLVARFPRTACIQIAQHWNHWTSSPCLLPQVVIHVAVDQINMEMLANEHGVPRERIRLVYNAVDMARIVERKSALPQVPKRMLVFAKNQSNYFDALQAACSSMGVSVELVGNWIGRPIPDPLKIIHEYDVVFGSARTALEAAACGAAVLVGDGRGLGGMLRTSNYEDFRANNFGKAILGKPLSEASIRDELAQYDASDATQVSQIVRASARLDTQLGKLEGIFAEAIAMLANANLADSDVHRSLSAYLSLHLPRVVEGETSPRHRGIVEQKDKHWIELAEDCRQNVDRRLRALEASVSSVADQLTESRASLDRVVRNTDIQERLDRYIADRESFTSRRPKGLIARVHQLLSRVRTGHG